MSGNLLGYMLYEGLDNIRQIYIRKSNQLQFGGGGLFLQILSSRAFQSLRSFSNQIIFQIRDCEIWFVRFSTDLEEKTLALGNTKGKIYTWDLTVLLHD